MIGRRDFLGICFVVCAMRGAEAAESVYVIDPRYGTVEFTVSNLGLFTSRGWFRRFDATLTIDPLAPEHTRIVAEVDATSLEMPWQEAMTILRSPDFLDVARFPKILFRSDQVSAVATDRYLIRGLLEMRGVRRPQTFVATLLARRAEEGIADFSVAGRLSRSEFGMSADRVLIGDEVSIVIRARIRLAKKDADDSEINGSNASLLRRCEIEPSCYESLRSGAGGSRYSGLAR